VQIHRENMASARTNSENGGQIVLPRGSESVEVESRKVARGLEQPKKMLNMKSDPEMCMKTKDRTTVCPRQKATFVPGCRVFHTKIREFGRNCRLSCSYLRVGGTNPTLKNAEIREGTGKVRPHGIASSDMQTRQPVRASCTIRLRAQHEFSPAREVASLTDPHV
jgi:hypothetical protein